MKYVLSTLVLFSSLAFGETVVLYDDGSTYTLAEGEEVFVSSGDLFKATGSLKKSVRFSVVAPHAARDGDNTSSNPADPISCDELGFGNQPCEPEPEPEVEDPQPCDELGFGNVGCEEEEEEEEEENNGGFTFGRPASLNPFNSGK